MIKLHLGCGQRDFGREWFHIDGGDFPHVYSHDITKLGFPDKTVDLIYASHVLSYFDRDEAKELLKEWHRVLKTSGCLRLAVPDFYTLAKLYFYGTPLNDQNVRDEVSLADILGPLYGKMKMAYKTKECDVIETIYHKTVYDFRSLEKLLVESGFRCVQKYDWRKTEHAHHDDHSQAYIPKMQKETGTLISLNVECYAS